MDLIAIVLFLFFLGFFDGVKKPLGFTSWFVSFDDVCDLGVLVECEGPYAVRSCWRLDMEPVAQELHVSFGLCQTERALCQRLVDWDVARADL